MGKKFCMTNDEKIKIHGVIQSVINRIKISLSLNGYSESEIRDSIQIQEVEDFIRDFTIIDGDLFHSDAINRIINGD